VYSEAIGHNRNFLSGHLRAGVVKYTASETGPHSDVPLSDSTVMKGICILNLL
jgi:hypothetical protein